MAEFFIRARAQRSVVGLTLLVVAGALGLAACGGSTPPHVASLGNASGRGSTTTSTLPTGSTAQLLSEWGACMRSHGDPNQGTPTVDAEKVIQITLPSGYVQGLHGATTGGACGAYMTAAETELRGGVPPQPTDHATAEKFAQCMRANGIPDYPDPSDTGQQAVHATAGSDLDPANPVFQSASTLCANKTGFEKFGSATPQPGSINLNMAGGFGGKSDSSGGSAANSGSSGEGGTNG